MTRHAVFLSVCLVFQAAGATATAASPPCSEGWNRMVEARVLSSDGQGHGPDLGSDEWKSVIEFKLGVRGRTDVPRRDSPDWCRYIDRLVEARSSTTGSERAPAGPHAQGPSFACDKVAPGSIESLVCTDDRLSALDRQLASVYAAATRKAANEHPPVLKAEQRGWIKGRNECWKQRDDTQGCVQAAYVRRIAELQARYRLVPFTGPVFYGCDGNPANEVVATFFQTDPPTLIAERGDSVSFMTLQPSASGSRYLGRNESLWEHQGQARVTWGHGAAELVCMRK